MADTFTQFENLLLEVVDPSVHNLVLEEPVDPIWDLLDTFPAVERMGRPTYEVADTSAKTDYEASWRVLVQRGGMFSGGTIAGPTVVNARGTELAIGQNTGGTYLDPTKVPMRSYLKIRTYLKRLKGALTVNRQQIHNDIIANGLESTAMDGVEDAVYQLRKMVSTFCYSRYGIVARVNQALGATVGETTSRAWVTVDGGTCHRFVVGQRYFFAADNTLPSVTVRAGDGSGTANTARCVAIDSDESKVLFESETDEGNISVSDNDYILQYGMHNQTDAHYAPNGIPSLLIASGTYPDTSYTVTTSTELKAFIDDNSSSFENPTPELIALMCDKMNEAGKPAPSVVIANPSVWTLYGQLERSTQAVYNVTQGAVFTASGQVAGPRVGHGNYAFNRLSSSLCDPNNIEGIEPSTFRRFMPMGKSIRWAMQQGGVAGISGIFRPVFSSSQLTDMSVADCDVYLQLGQVDPRRCFRILGVHNQRTATAA